MSNSSLRRLLGDLWSQRHNKEFGYVALGNLLAAILGGVIWLLLASILPPDGYGSINYSFALAIIFGTASTMGMNTVLMTYIPKNVLQIRSQAVFLVIISTALIAVPLLVISQEIWLAAFLVGYAFYNLSLADALGSRAFGNYAFLMIGQKIAQIVFSLGLYYVLGVPGIILGFAISYLVFSYRSFRNLKHGPKFSEIRQGFTFVIHSLAFELSRTISVNSDKILIAPIYGFAMLGMYQIGVQFLMFVGIVPSVIYSYLLPREAAGLSSKNLRMLAIVLSGILAFLVIILSPYLIPSLFPNFTDSVLVVQILGIGIVPLTISSTIQSNLLANKGSKPVFVAAILYIAVQYTLMIMLGKILGAEGLAIATLIALSAEVCFLSISQRTLRAKP